MSYDARILNTGNPTTADPGTCWCVLTHDVARSAQSFPTDFGVSGLSQNGIIGQARGSSTGIGDTLLRIKGQLIRTSRLAVSAGSDVRLPTGDELNYHGTGGFGVKPFAAVSVRTGSARFNVSPHANVGFQWNGESALAGEPTLGTKAKLPNSVFYSAGATIGLTSKLTLVGDYLRTNVMDVERAYNTSVATRGNRAQLTSGLALSSTRQSFAMDNAAFGIKVKVIGNVVVTSNVLLALDEDGLRDRVVPLFGIAYSFNP